MADERAGTLDTVEAMARPDGRRHALGVGLVLAAGTLWSVAGPLVRAVEHADVWQILFFKSLWMVVTLTLAMAARHRGRLIAEALAGGRWTLIGGVCLGGSSTFWILSITSTTVANTLLVQAATPLIAALMAWAVLGERVARSTRVAMALALAGVGVMVGDGALDGRLFGNVAAILAVLCFAGFAVALRGGRAGDMTASLCLGGLIAMAVAWIAAGDLAVSPRDHGLCFLMGSIETGLGLLLFALGSRWVPAGELVLLAMVEVFLGPLIVWLIFAEVPSAGTLIGGALVIAAIVGQAIVVLRRGEA